MGVSDYAGSLMPAPIAAALICGYRAYRIHQAYEAAQTAKEAARMASDIAKCREEVKRVLKSVRDWVQSEQLKSYASLMNRDEKKVALLRVPEDCTTYKPEAGAQSSGKSGGKGRK